MTLEEQLKLVLIDIAETDTAIREMCRGVLTDYEIDGDSFGVPALEDIVKLLIAKIKKNIPNYVQMFINDKIVELGLQHLDKDEAECIVYTWLLKTKIYLIGETSHKWSNKGKLLLRSEIDGLPSDYLRD